MRRTAATFLFLTSASAGCGLVLDASEYKVGAGGSSGAAVVATAGPTTASSVSTSSAVASTSSSGGSTSTQTAQSSTGATTSETSVSAVSSSASTGGGGSASSLLNDCVLLLHMEEETWSSAGAVKDASGQNNDGTASGTATTTPNGKFGRGLIVDGNGWITVPNSPSLQPIASLTYSAWVYPTGLADMGAYPGIIAKRTSYTQPAAYTLFVWNDNDVYVDIEGTRFSSAAPVVNGTWYHLAVVVDVTLPPDERVLLYINGVPEPGQPADATFLSNTDDISIALLPQGMSDPNALFIGVIDEVTVWNRALSSSEIQSLVNAAGPL